MPDPLARGHRLGIVTNDGDVRPSGSALSNDEMAEVERILLHTLDEDDAMTVVQELMAAGYLILSQRAIERTMEDIAKRRDGFVRYERTEQGWETTFHEPEGV